MAENIPQFTESPEALTTTGTKIPSSTYFLFIDPAGGTSYSEVVCLTAFNFAGTTATNDDSTMCGPDTSPGNITSTIPFSGKTFLTPGTGNISAPDIFRLWADKTNIGWKIGKATPVTGDMTKEGQGFLSAYGENYDFNTTGAFSGTISVSGTPTQTLTP